MQMVTLQTGPDRLDFGVRGERFATYRYGANATPGFTALYAPGGRAILNEDAAGNPALFLAHGNIAGVAFGTGAQGGETGRILPEETVARRGRLSVGFQQTCAWVGPDNRRLLTETRAIRIIPGPGAGGILDLTFHLFAPEETSVTLGRAEEAFLRMRVAPSLLPSGGGQLRNSAGDYGLTALHGRSASWCAGVGVVQGETVGFALLDHPANPWHPSPWIAQEDGTLSPSPFGWQTREIAPRQPLALRYRLLIYQGYVDAGWADQRLMEFAQAVAA